MKERDFEDILSKYTELVEEGLTLKGRQVYVRGKYVDLLFEDRHGQTLIVELKKGTIKREHTAQLMDYAGHYLSPDDPTARVMLVGNRVPPNLRRSLDHFGFEWKEITVSSLIEFLREKDDKEFLSYFREEELKSRQRPAQKKSLPRAKTGSRTGLPRLQDARSFSELGDIIRARYPSYPTDYMDLLLLENKDKPLSAILEEFQQYAKKVDYRAFENMNYLLQHIRYRESRGWVFDSSGDPIDPVVRFVGFEPKGDEEMKRQLGSSEEGKDRGRIFTPDQFYESSYFRLCSPTSQSLLRRLMRRADSLGMRYVMKVRGDNAVAISDITSPGRNFATVWPRQSWLVAIVIGHTGREPYRSEEEIDSVLVPLIEKKYEEITGQVVRLAGLESDRDSKTESALTDSESEGRKIFERLINMKDWQKQETFTYHRKSQLKKVLDEFGSRIPYSFFADKGRDRNSEIYPLILACHFGKLKAKPEGLVAIKDAQEMPQGDSEEGTTEPVRSKRMKPSRESFWSLLLDKTEEVCAEEGLALDLRVGSEGRFAKARTGVAGVMWAYAISRNTAWVELEIRGKYRDEVYGRLSERRNLANQQFQSEIGERIYWDKEAHDSGKDREVYRITSDSKYLFSDTGEEWNELIDDLTLRMFAFVKAFGSELQSIADAKS